MGQSMGQSQLGQPVVAFDRRLRLEFHGSKVTSDARRLVALRNHRGMAERHIKVGRNAIKWSRLSCRKFGVPPAYVNATTPLPVFRMSSFGYNRSGFAEPGKDPTNGFRYGSGFWKRPVLDLM